MASWLVREKRVPAVIVELLEETRRQKAAGWRPPLLVERPARATLRQGLFAQAA